MKQSVIFLTCIVILVSCSKDENLIEPEIETGIVTSTIKFLNYRDFSKTNLASMVVEEYNIQDHLIKRSSYYSDTTQPILYSLFEYDNDNQVEEKVYNFSGGEYNLAQTITLSYNGDLLIKKEVLSSHNNSVVSYTDYTYDSNKNLLQESRIQVDPYFNWVTNFKYDANNLKTSTTWFDQNSDTASYTEYFYSNSQLINEKVYTSNMELDFELSFKYNSNNDLTEKNKTLDGETKIMETVSYSAFRISERIFYDWDTNWGYRLNAVQVLKYL